RRHRVVVHTGGDAGDDFEPPGARQHGFIDPVAGTDQALRSRQGGVERGFFARHPRIGNGHVMHLLQPRQLVRRQLAKHHHLLAPAAHNRAASSSARLGSPSVSPSTCTARAPIQAPRRTASAALRPSSNAPTTPTAKPSPAPTVSTTSLTAKPGT